MIHLSFDQDWAPAWATEACHARLVSAGLRGTLFVTHDCPALQGIRSAGALELGWHPNFLPGSSHGSSRGEVLDHLRRLVPEAVGLRSHCLVRSSRDWDDYPSLGLRYEANDLFDGLHGIRPIRTWSGLWRLPTYFMDDVVLRNGGALRLDALELDGPGLKILVFHPILLALNAADTLGYASLKRALQARGASLEQATEHEVAAVSNTGRPGMRDLFDAVIGALCDRPDIAGGPLAELVAQAERE